MIVIHSTCFENIRKILYIAQISFIYCDLLIQTSHDTIFIVHASYQLPYETTGNNCRGLCHLTVIVIIAIRPPPIRLISWDCVFFLRLAAISQICFKMLKTL